MLARSGDNPVCMTNESYTAHNFDKPLVIVGITASVIMLSFYFTVELRYGSNRLTVVLRIRNGNFILMPTEHGI